MKTSDCSRFVSEFLFPKNKRVRLWRAVRFWGTVRFWGAVRRFTDKKYGRSCKVCGERKSSESFARLRERPRYADNVLGKAPAIEIDTLYAGGLRIAHAASFVMPASRVHMLCEDAYTNMAM